MDDSAVKGAPLICRKSESARHGYLISSFTRLASIFTPGPMVVDTAMAFI
jgi:hypothetical protein